MVNRCTLAASVIAVLAVGGLAVATPARAQVGAYDGYYDYAPSNGYYDYAPGYGRWNAIIANSNPSVPFIGGDAALSYRYGKDYGFCGFTIAGC